MTPEITPGMTILKNSFQSTFLWATWLMPETAVVNVSAVWTPAEAIAGGTPSVINSVEEIMPKAMPNAPSIICAAKPTRMNGNRATGSAKSSVKICCLHPVTGR